MLNQRVISALKLMTGSKDESVLYQCAALAEQACLAYTRRTKLPDVMEGAVTSYAIIIFNRRGSEGDISRNEAGISYSVEAGIPQQIKDMLMPFRVARVGGKTYEAKTE